MLLTNFVLRVHNINETIAKASQIRGIRFRTMTMYNVFYLLPQKTDNGIDERLKAFSNDYIKTLTFECNYHLYVRFQFEIRLQRILYVVKFF